MLHYNYYNPFEVLLPMPRFPFPVTGARCVAVVFSLAVFLAVLPARADTLVLTSIKPLALLAREVVGDQGRVESLLEGSASPHDYPMKVSDIQRLRAADLVLWVGPELETFLARPLANIPAGKVLEAQQIAGMHWPNESREPEYLSQDEHFHDRDPHLWLDPRNGAVIARALAERLAHLDPAGAGRYRANAEALAEELADLDKSLQTRLQPVADRGFAVYHEGYGHFVQRYQLNQLGYITFGPEQRPGARHLYRLRQDLANARCLFAEPYYGTESAREMAEELGLELGELDPLGAGADRYAELLETMADSFLSCLGSGSTQSE